MQLAAAVSSAIHAVLAGPAQPARLLGAGPAAIYLAVGGDSGLPVASPLRKAARVPAGRSSGELFIHSGVNIQVSESRLSVSA